MVAKESRGKGGQLDDLVHLSFLTEYEKELLEDSHRRKDSHSHYRATVLWCWMSTLSAEMMEMIKLPPPNSNMLYTDLRAGIDGVHTLRHYLMTQLPFPYVHMITML